jgi:hypothetical protein
MIHSILPSDIELATRMREEGHSDDEVLAILLRRGIAREAADQLVDDLRNGRKIQTQIPLSLEIAPRRRFRRKDGKPGGPRESGGDEGSSEKDPRDEQPTERQDKKSKFRFWPWAIVILLSVVAAI